MFCPTVTNHNVPSQLNSPWAVTKCSVHWLSFLDCMEDTSSCGRTLNHAESQVRSRYPRKKVEFSVGAELYCWTLRPGAFEPFGWKHD